MSLEASPPSASHISTQTAPKTWAQKLGVDDSNVSSSAAPENYYDVQEVHDLAKNSLDFLAATIAFNI